MQESGVAEVQIRGSSGWMEGGGEVEGGGGWRGPGTWGYIIVLWLVTVLHGFPWQRQWL